MRTLTNFEPYKKNMILLVGGWGRRQARLRPVMKSAAKFSSFSPHAAACGERLFQEWPHAAACGRTILAFFDTIL